MKWQQGDECLICTLTQNSFTIQYLGCGSNTWNLLLQAVRRLSVYWGTKVLPFPYGSWPGHMDPFSSSRTLSFSVEFNSHSLTVSTFLRFCFPTETCRPHHGAVQQCPSPRGITFCKGVDENAFLTYSALISLEHLLLLLSRPMLDRPRRGRSEFGILSG